MINRREFEQLREQQIVRITEEMDIDEQEILVRRQRLEDNDNLLFHWESLSYQEYLYINEEN